MSTDIELNSGKISMVSFWGGNKRGVCVQLTSDYGYVQLDMEEAAEIAYELVKFTREEAKRRQQLLQQQIMDLKLVQKTVYNEISELDLSEYEVNKLAVSMIASFCPTTKGE